VSKLLSLGLGIEFCQNNVIITFGVDQKLVSFCQNALFCVNLNFSNGDANKRYYFPINM